LETVSYFAINEFPISTCFLCLTFAYSDGKGGGEV
jgi:hypothetical protein